MVWVPQHLAEWARIAGINNKTSWWICKAWKQSMRCKRKWRTIVRKSWTWFARTAFTTKTASRKRWETSNASSQSNWRALSKTCLISSMSTQSLYRIPNHSAMRQAFKELFLTKTQLSRNKNLSHWIWTWRRSNFSWKKCSALKPWALFSSSSKHQPLISFRRGGALEQLCRQGEAHSGKPRWMNLGWWLTLALSHSNSIWCNQQELTYTPRLWHQASAPPVVSFLDRIYLN